MSDLFRKFVAPKRKKKPRQGTIYVLHFDRPYKHARHYIGWTQGSTAQARIDQHLRGQGSPLVKAAVEAGIKVELVAEFPGTRDMERYLKNRNDNRGVCPVCRPEWLANKKAKKMELSLREVRELVRGLLRETTCPVCGGRGAYVGLNDIECPNKACSKFSVKQLQAGTHTPGVKAIELDWAGNDHDASGANDWQTVAANLGLDAKEVGAANGFPIVRFVGPEDKIKELIRNYNAGSGEDDQFYFDQMEDV